MRFSATFIFVLLVFAGWSQKRLTTTTQTWAGYIQQVRLSQRWGLTADVHFRTADDWVGGRNIALGRIGGVYYVNDRTQLSGGYAYFHYYAGENHPLADRPESRLWQQVLWISNYTKLRVQNRFRIEQRWRRHINVNGGVADDYDFNWRARMQLQLLYPLGPRPFLPGSVALMLADEAMLNFGKEIVYNTFDQNRLISGIQLQWGKNSILQVGYMNVFQQGSANKYRRSHVARIFFTHTLDLHKKTEKEKRIYK